MPDTNEIMAELAAIRAELSALRAQTTSTRKSPTRRDWRGAIRAFFIEEHPTGTWAISDVMTELAEHGIEVSRSAAGKALAELVADDIIEKNEGANRKATRYSFNPNRPAD